VAELIEVASGLRFPEGPIAMPDGSVILVEMFGPCITRVLPDGTKETVAEVPGGPNGLALGPDGALYVCNNGARFTAIDMGGITLPGPTTPENYIGGRIQRVDIATGEVTDLYTECDGRPLVSPNDIVFDEHGGFYVTDHSMSEGRMMHITGVLYGKSDGSSLQEVVFPAHEPNGVGLSPDGRTLYYAETWTGRVMRRAVLGPGQLAEAPIADPTVCLHGLPGMQLLDSMGVEASGNVCVATLINGGITVISSDGELVEFVETGDPLTTNICWGGEGLRTAYITLSGSGRLVKTDWPRPGLPLHFLNF
jgi:gluconolactonase